MGSRFAVITEANKWAIRMLKTLSNFSVWIKLKRVYRYEKDDNLQVVINSRPNEYLRIIWIRIAAEWR